MKRTELRLLFACPEKYTEEPIKICGWLRTSRNSKSVGFIELNDGTCFSNIQVVYEENIVNNYKEITKLNVGSSVSVTGNIILTPDAKQPFEMHATEIEIEGESTPDYPLQKKRHSLDVVRVPEFFLLFRLHDIDRRMDGRSNQIVHRGIDRQGGNRFDACFLSDIFPVAVHRMDRYIETFGNLLASKALHDEEEHLLLALR